MKQSILSTPTRDLYNDQEEELTFTREEQNNVLYEVQEDNWELQNLYSKFNL